MHVLYLYKLNYKKIVSFIANTFRPTINIFNTYKDPSLYHILLLLSLQIDNTKYYGVFSCINFKCLKYSLIVKNQIIYPVYSLLLYILQIAGVQSARNIRVIQPTDVSRQRVLPRYDFRNRLVNATPSVNRIMKLELQEVEGSQKIKIAKDDTVVFNRPKYFVGSSGSVWASEYMRLRVVEPKLFMLEIENQLSANVVSLLLAILDQLKYYILGTNPTDVSNVSNYSSCVHRKYEVCRATIVHKTLTTSMFGLDNEVLTDQVKDFKSTITAVINSCNQLTEQLKKEGGKIEITRTIRSLNEKCTDCLQQIQKVIPKLKSRIHEFTDAGPGVGVNNLDVKFRMAQIIQITDADFFVRHHLANGDSSHNEVERCQSYVGDAICDGGSIEWEYRQPYGGLSNDQLANMTLEELEDSEHNRMKFNAFKVCDELTDRINGAPAPGGFMKAYTSVPCDEMFFNDEDYVKDYLHATEQKRKSLPGANYFNQVMSFVETHFECGEKYIEFVKFSCTKSEVCAFCSTHGWVGPPCKTVPKPYPNYEANGFHYLSVLETPVEVDGKDREVDDFQPRKQARDHVKKGNLDRDEDVKGFCDKYMVEEILLRKYLDHLNYLDIRKRKRAEKKLLQNRQDANRQFDDYDWLELFNSGLLKKLKVSDLDKYLNHFGLKNSLKLRKLER